MKKSPKIEVAERMSITELIARTGLTMLELSWRMQCSEQTVRRWAKGRPIRRAIDREALCELAEVVPSMVMWHK